MEGGPIHQLEGDIKASHAIDVEVNAYVPTNCRFIEVIYNKCHKKGHIARACMSSSQTHAAEKAHNRQQAGQRPQHRAPPATRTHTIHRTDPDAESDESDSLPLL